MHACGLKVEIIYSVTVTNSSNHCYKSIQLLVKHYQHHKQTLLYRPTANLFNGQTLITKNEISTIS